MEYREYKDLGDLPEDDRIRQIGERVMNSPDTVVGFLTDNDPGKLERYLSKLTSLFPDIIVVGTGQIIDLRYAKVTYKRGA